MSKTTNIKNSLVVVGSSEDQFLFQISWLNAKSCCGKMLPGCCYDYLIFVPANPGLSWFFIENSSSSEHVALDDLNEGWFFCNKLPKTIPKNVQGPMTSTEMASIVDRKQKGKLYSLMIPQCFCYLGMTFVRQLFQDFLGIPHPGPSGLSNAICQDKALTRAVLATVPGVRIPKGEILVKRPNQLMPQPKLSVPFMVKPTLGDNSSGLSLCLYPEEVQPALEKAFKLVNQVVVEEFIPGREVRAGGIELDDGNLHVLSCKLEYILKDRKYPIRTTEDKYVYQTVEKDPKKANEEEMPGDEEPKTELVQAKDQKRAFLTPGKSSMDCAEPLSPDLVQKIDRAVEAAYWALSMTDFCLFDFRVHAETGEPYIIEACSFWSFAPISILSLLADRSEELYSGSESGVETWKRVAADVWNRTAAKVKRA